MAIRSLILIIGFFFTLVYQAGIAWGEDSSLYLSFEQRLAVSYALATYDRPAEEQREIVDRAARYYSEWSQQKPQIKSVKNFDEFLKLYRGEWPSTQSLDLDLRLIEARGVAPRYEYRAPSARVQKQIEVFLKYQNQQLLETVVREVKIESRPNFAAELMGLTWALSQEGQTQLIEETLKRVGSIIGEQFKQIENVGELMADSHLGRQQNDQTRILMKTLFTEYFSRLSVDSKKLIASTYLGGDLKMSDLQKFEIMIQNSGPQLQKLLQVVARQADMPKEMLEIFRTLENSVRPVPWVQVSALLQSEKEHYQFKEFERRPLGVGTMAQVHRAKLQWNGKDQDVVVRFIKPGIEERVNEDHRILKEVARILDANLSFRNTGVPQLTPLVEDITQTVRAELNQGDTIERQLLAKTRYEKTVLIETDRYKNYIEFHVPGLYVEADSKLMVQEMVFGKKLDKEVQTYKEMVPGLKRAIVEAMAMNWAREVLLGGGFFHSDLHQGNFMVDFRDPAIRVNILDFGMGGVITRAMQNNLLVLGAGIELLDAKIVTEAFLALSERAKNTVTDTQFRSLVEAKMLAVRKSGVKLTSDQWTSWALDAGLRLPYEFINLNRGLVIVNKLLQDSGSQLNVALMLKRMAMLNPFDIYSRLVLESKFSKADFVRLGWGEAKKVLGGIQESAPTMAPLCSQVFN